MSKMLLSGGKRSLDSSLSAASSKRRRSDKRKGDSNIQDGSMLVESLNNAGLELHSGDTPHRLAVDQAQFIKVLSKDVHTHLEFPRNIVTMMDTLAQYLEDVTFLQKSLSPTVTASHCTTARSSHQDSLLRLLLCVPDLQPKLLSYLLEKLAEIALTAHQPSQIADDRTEVSLPRLILAAIRFIPNIVDSSGMAEKLAEILQACPTDIQIEIITSLPEILNDDQHEAMAMALKEMLSSRALTCTILDSLANMCLGKELFQDLLNSVLKRLPRVSLSDLPAVVEFILSSLRRSGADAVQVIQELRDSIELTPTAPSQRPGKALTQGPDVQRDAAGNVVTIILENIHLSALSTRVLADAWIKCLDSVREVDEQKPFDLLLLLCLYDVSNRRRTIEALIRNKIRKGVLSLSLLKETLRHHAAAIRKYFTPLLAIAETLLRSAEPILNNFAVEMYKETFVSLDEADSYYQQEIVGDLISMVGTGGGGIITDSALRVLGRIAEEHSSQLSRYTVLITAMIDNIDSMSLAQFRQVMVILCDLAWRNEAAGGEDESGLRPQIAMMIKKQLDNRSDFLKKKGAIGAVAAARAIARASSNEEGDSTASASASSLSSSSVSVGRAGNLGSAIRLLEAASRSTKNYPEAAGLFMDELASVMRQPLPPRFAARCYELFSNNFEDEFVVGREKSKEERRDLCLPLQIRLTLDSMEDVSGSEEEEDAGIVLPLSEWVVQPASGQDRSKSAGAMEKFRFIPHFRLLTALNAAKQGSKSVLEDIDALLGCGIWLFPEQTLEGPEKLNPAQRDLVCETLFFCINWCREVVNSFAMSTDPELRGKVLLRLKNIVFLQTRLKSLLRGNTFRPPALLFGEDVSGWQPPLPADKGRKEAAKAGKGKNKKGGKRKGKVEETTMMNATLHFDSQRSQHQQPQASSTQIARPTEEKLTAVTVDLDAYRPFFRELDVDVFTVLTYDLLTVATEPSYQEEKKNPKLRPAELQFLLKDMTAKLEHRLVAATGRKMGAFGGRGGTNLRSVGFSSLDQTPAAELVATSSGLLRNIFADLDEIRDYFARLIQLHDGLTDAVAMFSEEAALLSDCQRLGLQAAATLFGWTGFQTTEWRPLLASCLRALVERFDASFSRNSSLVGLVERVVEYLAGYTESILSVDVAHQHLRLLEVLSHVDETSPTLQRIISSTARTYLHRDWQSAQGREKGAAFYSQVGKFLSVWLQHDKDPVSLIKTLFNPDMEELFDSKGKDMIHTSCPTVTKASLGNVYKVVLQCLVDTVRPLTVVIRETDRAERQFATWSAVISIVAQIVLLLKKWRNRSILLSVLKYSKQFVDLFVRQGLPIIGSLFRRRSEQCLETIKELQLCTRYLQAICNSSKTDSDVSLANYVPGLRKSLEALVFRVKAMMAQNNVTSSFVLGNLKNKNLVGEEIPTQMPEDDEDDDEEEGEEEEPLPEEEESDVEHDNQEEEDDGYEETAVSDAY